eukprot:TRINITY_DN2045_c1_g2_i1.p2 TRINITY_DN2045_c1_g2~~TRINITY_DN2045_c1_g2_i1.p2  ORF type:complete len:309 (-),score=68.49 TRINITY_DN2045_c1_g2_i1:304-1230(-)
MAPKAARPRGVQGVRGARDTSSRLLVQGRKGPVRKRPAARASEVSAKPRTRAEPRRRSRASAGNDTKDAVTSADPWASCDDIAAWRRAQLGYWRRKEASTEAVTGVPPRCRAADARESLDFLKKLRALSARGVAGGSTWERILDCGAGVGRNTADVLLRLPDISSVDLLEPAPRLRKQARALLQGRAGVGRFFAQPLQEFCASAAYDLVWMEWVLMYVPDADVVDFLRRCRLRLAPGGAIAVKENYETAAVEDEVDPEDFCVTRRVSHFEALFKEAGLRIVLKRRQKDWPAGPGAYPLMMWGLAPIAA